MWYFRTVSSETGENTRAGQEVTDFLVSPLEVAGVLPQPSVSLFEPAHLLGSHKQPDAGSTPAFLGLLLSLLEVAGVARWA